MTVSKPEAAANTSRKPEKGKFYALLPKLDGYLHGVEFVNEDRLRTPPRLIVRPAEGGFPPLREVPRLVLDPKEGKPLRDFNDGFSGYWLVSERLKRIFETVDPEGFEFVACDYTLPNGSTGPQYYLCDMNRTIDALDEENSTLRIDLGDEWVGGKAYNFAGGPRLIFKKDVVKHAHIFRTPFSVEVFCDRTLRDAVVSASKESEGPIQGIQFRDAADWYG